MYLLTDSLKNIYRQRRRYRLFIPLLLICSLLNGIFGTIAEPCREYSDAYNDVFLNLTSQEVTAAREREERADSLATTCGVIQTGVMLVGALAFYYVSAQMLGARRTDIGILYALGLTRGQIFLTFFIELFTVCAFSVFIGLFVGSYFANAYLNHPMMRDILPVALYDYISTPVHLLPYAFFDVLIALFPLFCRYIRLLKEEPADALQPRS